MKPLALLVLALSALLSLSAGAIADTVHLANGGKVVGTITELRLKIGPLEKALLRAEVKGVRVVAARWIVDAADGTRYEGALDSLGIRCVAGLLNFGGKTVQSLELGSEEKPAKDAEPKQEPGPDAKDEAEKAAGRDAEPTLPDLNEGGTETKLTAEQKAQIAALFKTVAALRAEYIKKAGELAQAELAAIKDKYEAKLIEAGRDVEEKRKEAMKYAVKDDKSGPTFSSGGLGVGLGRTTTVTAVGGGPAQEALAAADARKAQLVAAIKGLQAAARNRAHVRRERVNAYCDALYRHLLTGKLVSEDAMKKICEKAITGVK